MEQHLGMVGEKKKIVNADLDICFMCIFDASHINFNFSFYAIFNLKLRQDVN